MTHLYNLTPREKMNVDPFFDEMQQTTDEIGSCSRGGLFKAVELLVQSLTEEDYRLAFGISLEQ